MPVKLLPGGLVPVEDGVVAHLPVGDGFVNLPAAVYLAVQAALGLDALLVVLVDESDLRGTAHPAGHHVFPDDVGNVQKIDGGQLHHAGFAAGPGLADDLVDLVQHGHHGLVAAGGAAEHLQPLPSGADAVVFHNHRIDFAVFAVGEDLEIMLQRLGPALFGVADGDGDGVGGEIQVGVLQPVLHRAGGVGLVEDLHVCADFRQLFRILLQHAHPHAAAHHEQVKQVVVGVEAVNNLKGAVVVGHGVRVRHRGVAHPQGAARQELAQVVDVVVQLFRLFPRGGRQRAVVLYRPAHRLPPEFPPAVLGQVAGIGAGIHKGAQLLHGVGGMLVLAEELTGKQPLPPILPAPLLLLLNAVQDIGLGGAEALLLKQALLHSVLNGFNAHRFLLGGLQLLDDGLCGAGYGLVVVLPRGSGGKTDGPADEFLVKGNHRAVPLAYIHCIFPLQLYQM